MWFAIELNYYTLSIKKYTDFVFCNNIFAKLNKDLVFIKKT
jgi:hypothetical protein